MYHNMVLDSISILKSSYVILKSSNDGTFYTPTYKEKLT